MSGSTRAGLLSSELGAVWDMEAGNTEQTNSCRQKGAPDVLSRASRGDKPVAECVPALF